MKFFRTQDCIAKHMTRTALRIICVIAIIAAQGTMLRALADGSWRSVQISGCGCWVTGIVAQPKVPGLFYIRTDVGGCYRWNSATDAWVPITDFLPMQQRNNYGCESIAVDPNSPDTVYIACGEWLKNQFSAGPGTIYKSTDRGATWTTLGLTGVYMGANDDRRWGGERLAVQPGRAGVMLFGSRTQGLWRSVDGGVHWRQSSLPYPLGDDVIGVQAVAFDPNAPHTVYAAVSHNGLYRSTDSGSTWTNISAAVTAPGRLVVDTSSTVWMTFGNGVGKFSQGKWIDCTPSGAAADPYSGLAVNPRDPKNVLVSYGLWGDPQPNAIFETKNGGASWAKLTANITTDVSWYKAKNPHGVDPFDISNFLFDPNKAGSVWFVSGGGIWNTPDIARTGGATFFHKERGHEELCVTAIAAPASGPELVAGVMDVDGFAFDKGVDAYPSRMFVDTNSWAAATASIAYEEREPRNMVRLCVQGTLWNTSCVVALSSDGGLTWVHDSSFPTIARPESSKPLTPLAVAMSATDPANIVVDVIDTADGSSVWFYRKSAGAGWKRCSGLPAASAALLEAMPIAADPVAAGVFYAYVGGAIYRSTDGGATFQGSSLGTVGASGPADFLKLAAQPGVTGDLWLSEDNDNPNYLSGSRQAWEGLYHSRDAGQTWTKLPGITRAVTFSFGAPSPNGPSTLYYYGRRTGDSSDGIFRSTDLGSTWTNIQSPGQAIGDSPWVMAGSRQTFGRVFIGTSGRGIFYSISGKSKMAERSKIPNENH
ncbi:MAG: WD40/YVTN/BNR-like repeat-containing protein [Janthinobacterium lividum]